VLRGCSLIGLSELVAHDAEEYVAIVTALATDRGRLAALKQGLRARLADSPVCDTDRYTHNLEAAYRRMWRRYTEADCRRTRLAAQVLRAALYFAAGAVRLTRLSPRHRLRHRH